MTKSSTATSKEADEQPVMTKKEEQLQREKTTGFFFPNHPDKTPVDFARNINTGRAEGVGAAAVFGIQCFDLRTGTEGCILPCLFIWKRGRWLSSFGVQEEPLWDVKPRKISETLLDLREPAAGWDFSVWVVHGEGSPGNWTYLAYLLPMSEAERSPIPKHPMLWRKELKEGKSSNFESKKSEDWRTAPPLSREREWYIASWELLEKGELSKPLKRHSYTGGYGYGDHGSPALPATTKPATATTPVKAASALPGNTRFRHKCGHWFKENELPGHSKVCPAEQGDDGDFAVFCDDKCGCELIKDFPTEHHALGHKTLDHVSRCKPGFPRQPKEVETSNGSGSNGAHSEAHGSASVSEATDPSAQTIPLTA